ncbi:MAG: hypothetical protein ACYDEV_14785 [Acidiferrobacter sp.]
MNAMVGFMSERRFRSFMGNPADYFDDDGDGHEVIADNEEEQEADAERIVQAPTKRAWENGMPVGKSTAEICAGRAAFVGTKEDPRRKEATVLATAWATYPRDGQDLKYLALARMQDNDTYFSRGEIAGFMGREIRTVGRAIERLMDFVERGEASIGKRGRVKNAVDIDAMTSEQRYAWATKPRAKSMQGRKPRVIEAAAKAAKVATKAPSTRIRIPRRLVLVPVQAPAESVVKRVWGTTKPRARRIKTPDFTAPQLDFGALFGGEGWGIPPPTPGGGVSLSGAIH